MPGNKRWHFKSHGGSILIIREGKEIYDSKKGIPLGPVLDVSYGGGRSAAKQYKTQALEVASYLAILLHAYVYSSVYLIMLHTGYICIKLQDHPELGEF